MISSSMSRAMAAAANDEVAARIDMLCLSQDRVISLLGLFTGQRRQGDFADVGPRKVSSSSYSVDDDDVDDVSRETSCISMKDTAT